MLENFVTHLEFIANAHTTQAKTPEKRVRTWDQKTPYYLHSLWCASTLATETSLPQELRENGAIALLYHDITEDTTAVLPENISQTIIELINGLTFDSFSDEMVNIWQQPTEVRLLKLYDKVSNLLDGVWMNQELRKTYEEYVDRLVEDVENNFGVLNIVCIAKATLLR